MNFWPSARGPSTAPPRPEARHGLVSADRVVAAVSLRDTVQP